MPPAHAPPPRGSDDRGLPYGPESVAKDETYLCKISEGGPRQHTLQTRVRLRWSLLPLSAWPAERARGRVRIDALEQDGATLDGASMAAVNQDAGRLIGVFSSGVLCSPYGAVIVTLRGPVGEDLIDHDLRLVVRNHRLLRLEFKRQGGVLPDLPGTSR